MAMDVFGGKGRKRPRRHGWAKIGAANADIDNIREFLARRALERARTDFFGEDDQAGAGGADIGENVVPVHVQSFMGKIPQGHVQGWALLGLVDFFARKQFGAPVFNARSPGGLRQHRHGFARDAMFGIIKRQIIQCQRKIFKASRVSFEQGESGLALESFKMRGEGGEWRVGHAVCLQVRGSHRVE